MSQISFVNPLHGVIPILFHIAGMMMNWLKLKQNWYYFLLLILQVFYMVCSKLPSLPCFYLITLCSNQDGDDLKANGKATKKDKEVKEIMAKLLGCNFIYICD